MPQAVLTQVAPYLQASVKPASLTLVTSTLSNPANWLLTRFLQAGLQDADDNKRHPDPTSQLSGATPSIIFVSLFRPQDLWIEFSKKVVSFSTPGKDSAD